MHKHNLPVSKEEFLLVQPFWQGLAACSDLFAHLQTQHRTPRSHKVCLASMFRPLCTPKGYHNHTRYAWPACSDLFTHLQTQHRTPRSHKVCLASMFRPLCTPKGYHDHTKYAWSACSGLFAHLQDTTITQSMPASMFRPLHTYRTPQSHQVCLASMFRPCLLYTSDAADER